MLRPAVLGLLVAVLAIRLLARVRRLRGVPHALAWRYSVAEVGMVVGTAPWLWMILTPRPGAGGLSLVPFQDLAAQLSGPASVAVVQVGGNLLALAALGFFLPVRFPLAAGPEPRTAAVLVRVAGVLVAVSVTVELLQHVLRLGRVTSVDDVLVNAAGGLLAALCSRRWWAARSPRGSRASG
ncbi:VanZ family protein [Promicromonospora kroppenstedtii]|uniref:VanZ family protein n=1 Tax=Promicromonospora kroppenstedtii TaxID=440482 RepID=A0ABW7XEP0_9MICO